MLAWMPATAEHATGSFASLLGRYLAPEPKPAEDMAPDALAEDIAVISYEQALRAHTRHTPAAPMPAGPASHPEPKTSRAVDDLPMARPQPKRRIPLKAASVTVRLTDEEQRLLHERAEAAGITVSAYLRSCLFEVEKLRAEVRAAVEGLEASRTAPASLPPKKPPLRAPADGAAWRVWKASRWMGGRA